MRMRVYRCYACENERGELGRDFEVVYDDNHPRVKLHDGLLGEAATCPNCKLSNLHPTAGGNIVPVQVIHYEPPLTRAMHGKQGRGTIACDPSVKVIAPRPKGKELYASGEPLVVNCPLCKQTAEFISMNGGTLHPSFDVPLGEGLNVPELHEYKKPADPTQPPAEPLSEVK